MREAKATTGDGVSNVIKPIFKAAESPKVGAGEKKVRFADALSPEENKAIKDFSTAFNLKEDRMTEIFQANKTKEGITDDDKKYLREEGEKNQKFKESSFFKGLLPENDKKAEKGSASPAVTGNNFEEDPLKKRELYSGGQEKGGEEKKGYNKNLMLGLGFLFIACIALATGGAALPIIGGFLAASQSLFIAGAVLAVIGGAKVFIEDRFSKGNNNPGGMKMVEGVGAQGQGQAPENAQASVQEKAQVQTPAQEKSQVQTPAPDLMKLMKQDLQAQIDIQKDILRGFKQELNSNLKLRNIILNNTDSDSNNYTPESKKLSTEDLSKLSALPNVDKIEPDGIAKKSSQDLFKDIGIDSKSEKRTIEAQNLERPSSNRHDPSSKSWVERTSSPGSIGRSGAREA